MDVYKECFDNLTETEAWCASMCESFIAYGDTLGGWSDERYLGKYRAELGDERVEYIFNALEKFISENYVIITDAFTDSEGVSYNSIVKKEV